MLTIMKKFQSSTELERPEATCPKDHQLGNIFNVFFAIDYKYEKYPTQIV
jgi:hypothetical protein